MLKLVRPFVFLLATGIAFYSCTSDKKEIGPCIGEIPPSVSFSKNLVPLFHANCSLPGCHSGSSPQAHLNLEDSVAYSELTKPGKGYINTGQPNFSVLYSQMTSTTTPMPPSGLLSACQIDLVLTWIQQGAKNN